MRQVKLHRVVMPYSTFLSHAKLATDALESAENEGWPIRCEPLDAWAFPGRAIALHCDGGGAGGGPLTPVR